MVDNMGSIPPPQDLLSNTAVHAQNCLPKGGGEKKEEEYIYSSALILISQKISPRCVNFRETQAKSETHEVWCIGDAVIYTCTKCFLSITGVKNGLRALKGKRGVILKLKL